MRTIFAASAAIMFSVSLASACTWGVSHSADGEDAITEQSVMSTFDGTNLPAIGTAEKDAATGAKCEVGDADCTAAE